MPPFPIREAEGGTYLPLLRERVGAEGNKTPSRRGQG